MQVRQCRDAYSNLHSAFAETNTLANSLAEEVELGTTNDRASFDFDLFNLRRMNGELALDPFASDDTSDDKHFSRSGTAACDHRAAENLNPFFASFLNLGVHIDRVTDPEFVNLFLQIGTLDRLQDLLAHDPTTQRQKETERLPDEPASAGRKMGAHYSDEWWRHWKGQKGGNLRNWLPTGCSATNTILGIPPKGNRIVRNGDSNPVSKARKSAPA